MLRRRRSRAGERGQTLVLAIAFIGFFAVVTAAVLGFADVTALQHLHTEATATADSGSEGGAANIAADAPRSDLSWSCNGTDQGSLTMNDPSGSQVGYTVPDCNPGNTTTTTSTGSTCLLCILDQTPVPPATSPSASTTGLTARCAGGTGCTVALETIGGNDYLNGSIAGDTTMTACSLAGDCPGSAHIGVLSGATYPGCPCTPAVPGTLVPPASIYARAVPDPLASIAAPTGAPEPAGCGSGGLTWDATKGCSGSFSKPGNYSINPGVWNSISVSGQANLLLQAGVYVLTGPLTDAGQGVFCATGTIDVTTGECDPAPGVTIYMTCVGSAASGHSYLPCPTGGSTGGYMNFSGQGQVSISSPPCPAGEIVPQCPGYDGVAVLADPHLLDPGGVAASTSTNACNTTGTGPAPGTPGCLLGISGEGNSINGSVDTRSGGVALAGGGGDSITGGFLIANSLFISDNGKSSTGLTLTGPGSLALTNSCDVFDTKVYPGATEPPNPARAVIQQQCGAGKTSGVVTFDYGP